MSKARCWSLTLREPVAARRMTVFVRFARSAVLPNRVGALCVDIRVAPGLDSKSAESALAEDVVPGAGKCSLVCQFAGRVAHLPREGTAWYACVESVTFGGSGLDRAVHLRSDPPNGRVLPLWRASRC